MLKPTTRLSCMLVGVAYAGSAFLSNGRPQYYLHDIDDIMEDIRREWREELLCLAQVRA
jgi:hypothetical protein